MTYRFLRIRAAVLVLAASSICLAAMPAEAARQATGSHRRHPQASHPSKMPVAETKPAETASRPAKPVGVWASGEQDRACFRARRKLWQDGQGWVVKRVSVCP